MKQSTKTTLAIVVTVLVLVLGPIIAFGVAYIGHKDTAVATEEGIVGQYKADENTLAQMSLKVVEMMQVANSHTDDMVKLISAAMKGKYGDDGATAKMLWSNESTQTIDPSLKKEVMRAIKGGRTNFEQMQNNRIDMCRAYKTTLRQTVSGFFLSLAKFPEIDLATYCEIVSSSHAREAFETKIDKGLDLKNL